MNYWIIIPCLNKFKDANGCGFERKTTDFWPTYLTRTAKLRQPWRAYEDIYGLGWTWSCSKLLEIIIVRYLGPPKIWFRCPPLLVGWNYHFLPKSYLNFSFLAILKSYFVGTLTKFMFVWVHVQNTGLDKTD